MQARHCLVILFPLLTSHISFSHLSSHSGHLLFQRSPLSKYLRVGLPHGRVPGTPQSTHFTIVTTCSCSIHPCSHLSTNTPLLIALSSPLCHPRFKPQPSPHSLTEGHLCSQWLFPPHSPHLLFSTFLTCCASAFLGRAALFGQPHRTCPASPHPQHLVGCAFPS